MKGISDKLKWYVSQIMDYDHSPEDWLSLEKEVNVYIKTVSKDDIEYYTYSGAGEVLYMICSGIRYESQAS